MPHMYQPLGMRYLRETRHARLQICCIDGHACKNYFCVEDFMTTTKSFGA